MSEIRQYGGNAPPSGYVQFVMEKWPNAGDHCPGLEKVFPAVVWVRSQLEHFEEKCLDCEHDAGYRLLPASVNAFCDAVQKATGRDPIRQPEDTAFCPCYGRIIE